MNPSLEAREVEPLGEVRPPDLDNDRFIAIVGGAFTGVKSPHRILIPQLTNAVYGKIPDDPNEPEEAVPFSGILVCGTQEEIVEFQARSTRDALRDFAVRQELWADNMRFQETLKKRGVTSFCLGFTPAIAVTEESPELQARPNRLPSQEAKLCPADVEFIRKVFAAAFPGRRFTPLQMAECLLAYHNSVETRVQLQPPRGIDIVLQ